ncbi:hypothetical protein V6R21_11925 [Limibacter armeniacum]|uniref:AbiU2 domain-containing protein n=1 Tax=Limibacter armeniacum TaxID=466084 RepID=UPI002FE55413
MISLKEFEEEIRERENLLRHILIHKRDYEFLRSPESERLIRLFSSAPLFIRSRDAIFKILCIEVHILFSDLKTDKLKLTQLLEKIKDCREKAEWKDKLSKSDIKSIAKLINEGLENDVIKDLRRYRNKYLAHVDIDRIDITFFVTHFYRLIEIALEIVNLLRYKILEEQFSLEIYLPAEDFASIKNWATV